MGLNAIEFSDIQSGYQREQSMTAEMMKYPDSKLALEAARSGQVAAYPDVGVSGPPA